MKVLIAFVFLALVGAGCKQKVISGPELKKKLIETMQDHLDKTAQAGVQFQVKDVSYFPEAKSKSYTCEFQVHMHAGKVDTVGSMRAIISNDFKTVDRTR